MVNCVIAAVTWSTVLANHRRCAFFIPHFTLRITHYAIPHFTHIRSVMGSMCLYTVAWVAASSAVMPVVVQEKDDVGRGDCC